MVGHIWNRHSATITSLNVDFSAFIFINERPDYKKYRSVDEFVKFKILDGNLNWDDYTMIFPVEDLYRNRLTHDR